MTTLFFRFRIYQHTIRTAMQDLACRSLHVHLDAYLDRVYNWHTRDCTPPFFRGENVIGRNMIFAESY